MILSMTTTVMTCEVEMLQAQAATGWDIVSVDVKGTAIINYNLQSI